MTNRSSRHPSAELAKFAADLRFDDIPSEVIARAEDLFVDWFGSVLAGSNAGPSKIIGDFARAMGPPSGPSEVLTDRSSTSPLFAALINGAASHIAEQDDVHNASVFHPAAVIFPPALAVAQSRGSSGRDFLAAVVVGYEAGIRVGEFLGRTHYKTFHTTGTAGTIAAAAAVGRLLDLSPDSMSDAFGSAGTQAAGLWEFLRDAADSKPLHTAKAAANGLTAAFLAQAGFTGARHIFEGAQGMGVAMSTDADPSRLTDRLGSRWALSETSFKFHASCRHTHPAADALLKAMQENQLTAPDIEKVTAFVHQGAIDVLGAVTEPRTVHQAKFSMGTTLGLIAVFGNAGMREFQENYRSPAIVDFRSRVSMKLDPEIDAAYPARWIGKVEVQTRSGKRVGARVDEPKGDPGNTLSRDEIERKVIGLADFSGAASPSEMVALLPRLWSIADANRLRHFLRTSEEN